MSAAIRLRNGERIVVDEFPPAYLDSLNGVLDAIDAEEDAGAEIDALELLAFEAPCEVSVIDAVQVFGITLIFARPRQCTGGSTFVMECRKCHDTSLVCLVHEEEIRLFKTVQCAACRQEGTPEEMMAFVLMDLS